ncbi:hypothetical protein PILCRDRAFT_825045 [Piloderma croceum F 1598]|uniref:Uncharacterized protein n=1 Tax=Piloderma croceum (strain F 1598) TaxID=765440 RepID=A0A0C3BKE4_PILCF|nr:hypothetical protein PILCRDRAFT_825045 [Piloderma croceum F 1598]
MPLGFIVNLVAYNLEHWPDKVCRCERYVRYEGVMTAVGVEVVGLMMLIRINALYYNKSRLVVAFMACILLLETVINVYLLVYAIPVEHWNIQNQVHSCSMIYGSPKVLSSGAAWIPLLYDTLVLLLTLYVTVPSIRRSEKGFIVRTILTDGLKYYAVICVVTMVLTIMIAGAPPGLKNITAQLQLLFTVTMMSRITIHLKKQVNAPSAAGHRYDEAAADVTFSRDRSFSDVMARKRSHSSSSSADFGITFVRPPPARLSTIWSERSSDEWCQPYTNIGRH